jgi:four helix bundle protein
MKTFNTLELAIEFYELTSQLEAAGPLKDQLNRASSSISLNLSEGNAKGTAKDKRRYFQTAYGSLRECQTIFRLLKVEDLNLLKKADQLGASLYRLVNSNIKDSPNWKKI